MAEHAKWINNHAKNGLVYFTGHGRLKKPTELQIRANKLPKNCAKVIEATLDKSHLQVWFEYPVNTGKRLSKDEFLNQVKQKHKITKNPSFSFILETMKSCRWELNSFCDGNNIVPAIANICKVPEVIAVDSIKDLEPSEEPGADILILESSAMPSTSKRNSTDACLAADVQPKKKQRPEKYNKYDVYTYMQQLGMEGLPSSAMHMNNLLQHVHSAEQADAYFRHFAQDESLYAELFSFVSAHEKK